ncbi:hypothetical protein [Actinopolymorpha alba]|uniref:hypothetical protein n=1 Tax=Actinopolymorpha alba TaxID=533267 RepID=UPI00036D5CD9|nr:hypothetical protein [Actinopolymorpha alba]
MDHRSRTWIRGRLRSLASLELLNVPLQAVIWFGIVGFPVTPTNVIGFALFAFLLLEGAGYWLAKVRQIAVPGSPLPGAGAFAVARVVNLPALIAGLLFIIWAVVIDPGAGSLPGLGFAVFAVLEHVNYFHTQLMYDNADDLRYLFTHGLRRAHLARDLALHRKTGRRARRRLISLGI